MLPKRFSTEPLTGKCGCESIHSIGRWEDDAIKYSVFVGNYESRFSLTKDPLPIGEEWDKAIDEWSEDLEDYSCDRHSTRLHMLLLGERTRRLQIIEGCHSIGFASVFPRFEPHKVLGYLSPGNSFHLFVLQKYSRHVAHLHA